MLRQHRILTWFFSNIRHLSDVNSTLWISNGCWNNVFKLTGFPWNTSDCFNADSTSFDPYGRQMNVETTLSDACFTYPLHFIETLFRRWFNVIWTLWTSNERYKDMCLLTAICAYDKYFSNDLEREKRWEPGT